MAAKLRKKAENAKEKRTFLLHFLYLSALSVALRLYLVMVRRFRSCGRELLP